LDDKSLEQSRKNVPADVRSAFHVDEIQALVVKYASEPFEIAVEFVEHNGLTHPVIVVPPGVRTPVAAKAGLKAEKDGKPIWLIGENDVYFRTMESSGVVASAKILWKDWRDLVEICFDNREADIGRFLRRHLAGVDPATLAVAMGANAPVQESIKDRLKALLADGLNRFKTEVHDRGIKLPPHGSWEVALIIDGELPSLKLDEFANVLHASNPGYTGWPVWLNSRHFSDAEARPYSLDGAWQAFIADIAPSMFPAIDFMRQDPNGSFYLYRALEDDISLSDRAPEPMKFLDPVLTLLRVAEAIAVGMAFAKALKASEQTKLEFMFRWSGLKGRQLNSWSNPMRHVSLYKSRQDTVTSTVNVPIDTPASSFAEYVKTAIQPLSEAFEGFTIPGAVVEEMTQKMLERRL
jgi:hypothetical protein